MSVEYESGDNISFFLHDWEVAKVALGCHMSLDVSCQEMHEVEWRRGWFRFSAGLLSSFLAILIQYAHHVSLWNKRRVSNVSWCLLIVSEGRKEVLASF